MSGEGDSGWEAEGWWSDPYCDVLVAGVPLPSKSCAVAAPKASPFLTVFRSLICVCRSYRG